MARIVSMALCLLAGPGLTADGSDGYIYKTAKVRGDVGILARLAATLVEFNPRFEFMPGTAGPAPVDQLNDYEVGRMELRGE